MKTKTSWFWRKSQAVSNFHKLKHEMENRAASKPTTSIWDNRRQSRALSNSQMDRLHKFQMNLARTVWCLFQPTALHLFQNFRNTRRLGRVPSNRSIVPGWWFMVTRTNFRIGLCSTKCKHSRENVCMARKMRWSKPSCQHENNVQLPSRSCKAKGRKCYEDQPLPVTQRRRPLQKFKRRQYTWVMKRAIKSGAIHVQKRMEPQQWITKAQI